VHVWSQMSGAVAVDGVVADAADAAGAAEAAHSAHPAESCKPDNCLFPPSRL